MTSSFVVTTPPAAEPITLAEARLQLKADDSVTTDDTLISALIQAAREHVEKVCERALMPQTWRVSFDTFPAGAIEVPGGKVRTATLRYLDAERYSGTYVRTGMTVVVTLAAHGYLLGDVVPVTAAADGALTGGQLVTAADAGTFTFVDTDAAGATSGSITVQGRWQQLDQIQKDLDRQPARLLPAPGGAWPVALSSAARAVQVTAEVGYADAASVPAAIKAALLEMVEDMYRNRGTIIVGTNYAETPVVQRLLRPHKRIVP